MFLSQMERREGRVPTTIMFNSATIQLKLIGKEKKKISK